MTVKALQRPRALGKNQKKQASQLQRELDSETTHECTCGNCNNEFHHTSGIHNPKTMAELVKEAGEEMYREGWRYADSDKYGMRAIVCGDCMTNEDEDWKEMKQ